MKEKIEFNLGAKSYSNEFTITIGLIREKEGYVPLMPTQCNNDCQTSDIEVPELPIIEFGLVKKGTLNISDKFQVPMEMTNFRQEGNGAIRTHPSTDSESKDATKAAKNILDAFNLAVQAQVESKGYLHQPFFIRYAVRMSDGSHPRISPPVLMLPTMFPPCLGIESMEAKDECAIISLSTTTHNYFTLNYRIAKGIPVDWTNRIAGIDFFMTEPIPTFDNKSCGLDGILPYSKIIGTTEDAFLGHWSEGDGYFIDHSVSDCGLHNINAWSMHTNDSLNSSLASPGTFYKVATLAVDEISPSTQFKELPIHSTSKEGIRMGEILDDEILDLTSIANPIIVRSEGLTNIYFSDYQLPELCHLRSAMPFAGNAADTPENQLKITIRGKRFGKICSRTTIFENDNTPLLTTNFPRIIFFNDPSVCEMQIKQGLNQWILPMRPTIDGKYSVWSRGFISPSSTVEPYTGQIDSSETNLDTISLGESRIAKSSAGSFIFKECTTPGIGKVTAATATIAVSDLGLFSVRKNSFAYIDCPIANFTVPDLPYWAHLCPVQLPDFSSFLNSGKIAIKSRRAHIESSVAEGLQCVYSIDNNEWALTSNELEAGILLTAPITLHKDNGLAQISSISFHGKFAASHVYAVLYASNDKKNWMLAAASKSPSIQNICGIKCRYWRAAAICNLDSDEYIDGLIFDYE